MEITLNAILTGNYVIEGKITGGKRGYIAAIQQAHSNCRIADPEIRYSHQRGFYVAPWEADVIWYEKAYHDGKKMAHQKDYTETRRHICKMKNYIDEVANILARSGSDFSWL